MNFSNLLKPIKIDKLNFKNRIVMPPMTTFFAKDDGLVTQSHLEHYKQSIGPGLMIVEGTCVSPEGRVSRRQLGIHTDRHIEGLARLAQIIHEGGAVAGIQIHHAGATAFALSREEKKQQIIKILFRWFKQQITVSFLHRIKEAFRNAARRAAEAGFDIIELHAAHGYLFTQFLSPLKNWRIDRYGGNPINRRRFLLDVYQAAKEEVAGKASVTCRLGVADGHKRGLPLSEGLAIASILEKKGMKLLDVSNGSGTFKHFRPKHSPYSARMHLAYQTKMMVQIPVIGGGGIRSPELAEKALQDNMADLISVGRGLLADPAWARKTIAGKSDSIAVCRECQPCFHFNDPSKCPARKRGNIAF